MNKTKLTHRFVRGLYLFVIAALLAAAALGLAPAPVAQGIGPVHQEGWPPVPGEPPQTPEPFLPDLERSKAREPRHLRRAQVSESRHLRRPGLPDLREALPQLPPAAAMTTAAVAAACNVPSGAYATIATALADPTCDPINVAAGTYNENLVVSRSVTIQGVGQGATTIDGSAVDSVFVISPTVVATLADMTITNGQATDGGGIYNEGTLTLNRSTVSGNEATGDFYDYGGGILNDEGTVTLNDSTVSGNDAIGDYGDYGGGIFNDAGTVTLNDSTVSGNDAIGDYGGYGGGILNDGGTLTLTDSTVSGNQATGYDYGYGGGIDNWDGTVTLNGSIVSGNEATGWDEYGCGGGILNDEGTVTLTDSTVSDNLATSDWESYGGGIDNYYDGATLTLNNSTVSGNRATYTDDPYYYGAWCVGGGVDNYDGTVTLTDSTVSDNQATGGEENWGGGINNEADVEGSVATMTLTNSTVSGNQATGGEENWGGGISNDAYDGGVATMTLTNCTVSDNEATNDGGGIYDDGTATLINSIVANSISGGDCHSTGTVNDGGYNLVEDGTCGFPAGGDPVLGPLQDNGGPTWTHALLPGSPAIDAIPPANCPVDTDQRGVTRPQGNNCDIGAYEWQPPVGGIIVPVNRLELLAPWLGLVALALLAAFTVVLVRRRRA